ncbi:MAG: hypothetical protein MRY83_08860 [Flavobacteriales bacterium]|nr:hypothetical protein [Flavobacteriales bacterium]
MKTTIIILLIIGFIPNSFAQDSKFYENKEIGLKVEIPEWLNLKETGNKNLWGGTFPALDGIENALMISGFDKTEYKSFEEFKKVFITGNTFGKTTLFSDTHIWYGYNKRDLIEIKKGVSCRVFTLYQKKIYHNQFCLIETDKAFVWIQFVATPETYDTNIEKFNSFVGSIKYLN